MNSVIFFGNVGTCSNSTREYVAVFGPDSPRVRYVYR